MAEKLIAEDWPQGTVAHMDVGQGMVRRWVRVYIPHYVPSLTGTYTYTQDALMRRWVSVTKNGAPTMSSVIVATLHWTPVDPTMYGGGPRWVNVTEDPEQGGSITQSLVIAGAVEEGLPYGKVKHHGNQRWVKVHMVESEDLTYPWSTAHESTQQIDTTDLVDTAEDHVAGACPDCDASDDQCCEHCTHD